MIHRSIASLFAPFVLGGCVSTHALVLGADHPANPAAAPAAYRVASVETLGSYQSSSGFSAGSSSRTADSKSAGSPVRLAHDGHDDAHASGVVNSVNAAQHKINITHEPIPAIGWPSMTMDFDVAPSVDLSTIKRGARVDFTMEKDKGGMYEIQAIRPAAAK